MILTKSLIASISIRTVINYMNQPTFYYKRLKKHLEAYELEWQKHNDNYMEHIALVHTIWDAIKAKYTSHIIDHEPTIAALFYQGGIPMNKILVDVLMEQYVHSEDQEHEVRSYNLSDEIFALMEKHAQVEV